MPRIISRAEGGIVPLTHTSARVARPAQYMLLHHTGATGPPNAGWTDAQHMAALQRYAIGAGKTWEYNYVITYPNGWIWEMAGPNQGAHCANANGISYGIQINQADDHGPAGRLQVDSFRWLLWHLITSGAVVSDIVARDGLRPHYGLRSTGCSATDLSNSPGARRPSTPTGEGSFGSVRPEFLVPWTELPPPPEDDMPAPFQIWADPGVAYYRVDPAGQTKILINGNEALDWNKALLSVQGYAASVAVADNPVKLAWLRQIPETPHVAGNAATAAVESAAAKVAAQAAEAAAKAIDCGSGEGGGGVTAGEVKEIIANTRTEGKLVPT